jgi:Lrp/AsnC family transcriptional regulator, leucine-responsive regulatory protein
MMVYHLREHFNSCSVGVEQEILINARRDAPLVICTLGASAIRNREPKLDVIDRKILQMLQRDGRISNVDLAKLVHLSPTPCFERVRRLEESGYIERYVAQVSASKLGLGLLAFVEISLDRTHPAAFDELRALVADRGVVQECHMVAGGFDYLLKVRIADMAAFRRFLGERILALPGISRTNTYFVMEEIKATQELPIGVPRTK